MLRSQSNESSPYELSNGLITTCQTSYRPVLLCNLDFPVGQLIYRFSQRDVEAGAHELHMWCRRSWLARRNAAQFVRDGHAQLHLTDCFGRRREQVVVPMLVSCVYGTRPFYISRPTR